MNESDGRDTHSRPALLVEVQISINASHRTDLVLGFTFREALDGIERNPFYRISRSSFGAWNATARVDLLASFLWIASHRAEPRIAGRRESPSETSLAIDLAKVITKQTWEWIATMLNKEGRFRFVAAKRGSSTRASPNSFAVSLNQDEFSSLRVSWTDDQGEPVAPAQVHECLTRHWAGKLRGKKVPLGKLFDLPPSVHGQSTTTGQLSSMVDEEGSTRPPLAPSPQAGQRWNNPKPVVLDQITENDAYLMFGNHTSPINVCCEYEPTPLQIPDDIGTIYSSLAKQAKDRARLSGRSYFDGPCARLLRFRETTTQDKIGYERKEVTLHLGPVSWEQFTVLNDNLHVKHSLPTGETIHQKYAIPQLVVDNDRDFSWCKLSNILIVTCTPITSDGYALVQVRNPHGVSTQGGQAESPCHTTGDNENIHRYLDAIDSSKKPHTREHALEPSSDLHVTGRVTADYELPAGHTLDLYLTASRGIHEELSPELARLVPIEQYRFLNLIYDSHIFQPALVGVVELAMPWHEVKRIIHEHPGNDHPEYREIEPVRLGSPRDVDKILRKDWLVHGRAALMSAVHYWREHAGNPAGG